MHDQDPRDVLDAHALQDARDDSDPDEELCAYCDHSAPGHRFDGYVYHECFVGGCGCGAYTVFLPPGPLGPPTERERTILEDAFRYAHERVEALPDAERQAWRDRYDTREEYEDR